MSKGVAVMTRRRGTGRFELQIPAADAIGLFTPEGERAWVPGWDPTYPEGQASETSGTVFRTSHGDNDTIWTVHHIDRRGCTAAYSRHSVGNWAGTVQVRCEDLSPGRCSVTVDYDTTLLPGGDPSILHDFDEPSYAAMMDEWATLATAGIAHR